MTPSSANPRELIAAAKLLLSEMLEEGIDHVETLAVAEAEPVAAEPVAEPARTSPGPVHLETGTSASTATPPRPEVVTAQSLLSVREDLGDCTRCPLCEGRKNIVFGDGNPQADLMFIGEGPGANEDEQGLPFVGRAGELLTQMIEKGMGLSRSDVYICNIVKCRPPGNRNPLPQEVSACRPFLDGQIDAVQPKVIVSLGKPATGLLLDREVAITRIRGTWHDYRGIDLMPTLHPAFVLRQYTEENRRAVWQDLKAALGRLKAN